MKHARPVGLCVALLASSAWAYPANAVPARNDDPAAIYDVSLPIDGTVIVASTAGILIAYALASRLVHPSGLAVDVFVGDLWRRTWRPFGSAARSSSCAVLVVA